MTTVRRARIDDARRLRQLTAEGVAREAAAHPEDRIGISEEGLDNLETHYRLGARHPNLIVLVAEEDGELVGFVDAEIVPGRSLPGLSGEIGDLYLGEGAGPEVAQALVREAIRLLRERGARVIVHTEDATRPEREPWESVGFEADVVRFSLYD